jgi:hypothetical protein
VSIRQAPHRRMDRSNWQPMCRPCNSRKGIRQEGAFGNRPTRQGVASDFGRSARDPRPPTTRDLPETGFFTDVTDEDFR